jgi:diacylglycerol kinase (ATP)
MDVFHYAELLRQSFNFCFQDLNCLVLGHLDLALVGNWSARSASTFVWPAGCYYTGAARGRGAAFKGVSMKNRPFPHRLGFALAGIVEALRSENSFRLQCLAAGGVLVALIGLRPAPIWWAVVALAVAMVLAAEQFNTALERLADLVDPGFRPEIKIAKDCAAGAVLLASLGALAVAAAFVVALLS